MSMALTDEAVKGLMTDFHERLRQAFVKAGKEPLGRQPRQADRPPAQKGLPLTCYAVLNYLGQNPFTKIWDLQAIASLGTKAQIDQAIKLLQKHKLVEIQHHRTSGTRPAAYAVINDQVLAHFDLPARPGRGSFHHQLYQDTCRRFLEAQGFKVWVEGQIRRGGKFIDVLAWSKEQGYLAHEITLNAKNLVHNITVDLAEGASRVVVVTVGVAEKEEAVELVNTELSSSAIRDQIVFRVIKYFSEALVE